jgi:hypothetical protein
MVFDVLLQGDVWKADGYPTLSPTLSPTFSPTFSPTLSPSKSPEKMVPVETEYPTVS